MESIPPAYRYRFGVYNGSGQWIGNSSIGSDGTQFFSVIPTQVGAYNYYYIRVYSEDEYLGPAGYSPTDTYEVRAEVTLGILSNGYPAP